MRLVAQAEHLRLSTLQDERGFAHLPRCVHREVATLLDLSNPIRHEGIAGHHEMLLHINRSVCIEVTHGKLTAREVGVTALN